MALTAFSDLPLPGSLLLALAGLGFAGMLPVQEQTLPVILAGRDVLVQADTGSGKTLAFGLGMLAKLESRLDVQALCLCPTRELCEQVSAELRRLASRTPNVKVLTLCGGVPFAPQRASLKQGAHLVIGTPGRVEEHLRKGSVSFAQLRMLVLDEADRMLDMGFEPQIARVLQHVPPQRQTLLFSATYRDTISELSRRYQTDAERIRVESSAAELAQASGSGSMSGEAEPPGTLAPGRVEQRFFRVSEAGRLSALARWLGVERPESALVFCNTKVECEEVRQALLASGWAAACIHGDLAQRERQHVMRLFANGSCSVLAATDVAARGWDIPDLPVVVNLGLSRDPIQHLHRQGRTGRLGRAGLVVSFVSGADGHALGAIERVHGQSVTFEQLSAGPARLPAPPRPARVTLILSAGKNKKLRPGDILGALTADGGIPGSDVGMIQIDDSAAYVAIATGSAEQARLRLNEAGVKGRSVKARIAALELRDAT
ncbi:MAG TPA: DEAD/DEAH box helicase [Polyangiaceae bacterium]|nr:DEAD/DEAH box helicase [Polyangiaceae bacterium]